MRKALSVFIFLFTALSVPATAADKKPVTDTVVLVTIDGLRWQEVFRGVDPAFFDHMNYMAYKDTHADFKRDYGGKTPEERRQKLMPFFWSVIAKQGQLYGNRDKGSKGHVTNPYHFSYPGYSEILTGIPDPRVNSNDKVLNPNRTVLEWLIHKPENKGKVAAFGSWDVFPFIINEGRSGVPVNAGFEPYPANGDQEVAMLDKLQADIPSPWDTVRLDAFTMGFARAALRHKKMRMVFIGLGETDDFAHEGFYDQYANAAHRADKFIGKLWAWLQSDPRYAGHTTLLITCDHGRGGDTLEHWRSHGHFPYTKADGTKAISNFPGDGQIWMAALGPDTPALGEISGGEVTSSQMAATAARFLGYKNYKSDHATLKAGKPVLTMLGAAK
ncbi:alkaline phosphatase family protein [Kordiimonas marina]|uniref:alkaline phosphatase family protein n=1 Tax=Kordiimonas marina TaxID=2872312 RepID=UPI001FF16AAD